MVVADEVPAERVRGGGARRPAASCFAHVRIFDLYRGDAGGRGTKEPGAAARVPGARPHPHRRGGRRAPRGDRARPGGDRGLAPCLRHDRRPGCSSPGASGFSGALAARLVWRHPRLELAGDHVAQRGRQAPRRGLPAPSGADDARRSSTSRRSRRSTPRSSPIRTGPPRRWSPSCATAESPVVDLSADFRLRDLDELRALVRRARRARAPRRRGLRPHRAEPRGGPRALDLVANPGCYPTAALLALAPMAEAGLVDGVVVDAKSGVSGAGRGGGDALHFSAVDENFKPYKVDGHRHSPELEQELRVLGARRGRSRSCRICSRSTRGCSPAAT